jgi:hypothetical protein
MGDHAFPSTRRAREREKGKYKQILLLILFRGERHDVRTFLGKKPRRRNFIMGNYTAFGMRFNHYPP